MFSPPVSSPVLERYSPPDVGERAVPARPWPERFKDVAARLAAGVGVAACWTDAGPVGLLVSSIVVVSVEPPKVLFCVRKAARSHEALLGADHCGLSLLSEADRLEAERFSDSERAHERFDPSRWSLVAGAPPLCRTALAGLAGPISTRLDAGTHTVFIVNVGRAETGEGAPLLYFDRRFAGLRGLAEA